MANDGKRFIKGSGIAKHREWRGLKDTFYDYTQWVVNLGLLVQFVAKSPVRIMRGMLEYRWLGSYLGSLNMVDKCMAGMRGPAARHHERRNADDRRQHEGRPPLRRHEICRQVRHA